MPKAILITTDNASNIEKDYLMEDGYLADSKGMYMVADFGSRTNNYGILNKVGFTKSFTITGAILNNDWFEVVAK